MLLPINQRVVVFWQRKVSELFALRCTPCDTFTVEVGVLLDGFEDIEFAESLDDDGLKDGCAGGGEEIGMPFEEKGFDTWTS